MTELPLQDYPLLRYFPQDQYTTVYDARTHFATNIAHDQIELFTCFLRREEPAQRLSATAESTWSILQRLREGGAFLPGAFSETFTTDELTIERIVDHYDRHVVTRKFCLEVTEDCNFRCTYCPYTNSAYGRKHSSERMSKQTATRAIDRYFERYSAQFSSLSPSAKEYLLEAAPPSLSWYGGECFLNFEVVRYSQEYFATLPWQSLGINSADLRYSVNTNLSISSSEITKFLVRNDVLVYISLDGPSEQNDLHRVYRTGKGTFHSVISNLSALQTSYPEFVKSNVVILATICQDHDRDMCASFLRTLDISCVSSEVQVQGSSIPNPIEKLRQLSQQQDEAHSFLRSAIEGGIPETFWSRVKCSERLQTVIKSLRRAYFDITTSLPIGLESGAAPSLGMRTCPVGFDQLMVATNGNYHMCHKTDGSWPIGNCATGYDHKSMLAMYQDFHRVLNSPQCKSCWAIRFCTICSAPLLRRALFCCPSAEECEYIRASVSFDFQSYQILCEHPKVAVSVKDRVSRARSGVVDTSRISPTQVV